MASALDWVFVGWFVLHIPVTLFVDGQSVLPFSFPDWAVKLVAWHVDTNGDWLVGSNPLWFRSLIAAELAFQLPCFFLLAYGLLARKRWARFLGMIYGIHAATTFVPILAEILLTNQGPGSLKLFAIYVPYLVVPAAIAVRMAGWEFPSAPRGGGSLARSGVHSAAKGVGVKGGLEWPQGEARAPVWRRPYDLLLLAYFASHIPITALLDAQSILPRASFPRWAVAAMDWHIQVNSDHLVQHNPTWFVALVWCECLVQLPSFFLFIYAILNQKPWVRVLAVLYGAHVATTLIPILVELLLGVPGHPKVACAAVYAPYLLVPLSMVLRFSLWPCGAASPRMRRKAE